MGHALQDEVEVRGYRPKQVSRMLNISLRTVYDLCERGQLRYHIIGGVKLITADSFEKLLRDTLQP